MTQEELTDQKQYLEETFKPKCIRPLQAYQDSLFLYQLLKICDAICGTTNLCKYMQACIERVKGDETGQKHCTGQYFDYWSCVDGLVAPSLFEKLK
ncbi:hypothetical protein ZIOFF_061666 [Zingiber officinale]|uniref:Cytochrome b-c1 complex subunit 6 n=1 Tax=Zingiber officinale TaxID=94328 RepID=A0A8J5F2R6_ZINOF|nr:hypothetical protein ZIOFF_061666 [Zingiber officinale]